MEILKTRSFDKSRKTSDAVSIAPPSPSSPSPCTSTPVKNNVDLSVNLTSSVLIDDETVHRSVVDMSEDSDSSQQQPKDNQIKEPRGSLTKSKKDWLSQFSANFVEIVVQGLESSMRSKVKANIEEGKKLPPKQNKSVISSVNHKIFKYVGSQRPDASLCRYVIDKLLFSSFPWQNITGTWLTW